MTRRLAAAAAGCVLAASVAAAVAVQPPAVPPPAAVAGGVEVPCRPVVIAGRAECRWEVDARRLSGARVVYLDPAPGPSAAMVREQITDARRGTP